MGTEQYLYSLFVTLQLHKRPVQYHMWSLRCVGRPALILGAACGPRRCGCGYAPIPEPGSSKVNMMTLDAVSVRL